MLKMAYLMCHGFDLGTGRDVSALNENENIYT